MSDQKTQESSEKSIAQPVKRWYIVRTHTGKEMVFVESLKQRIIGKGLESKFGEVKVPTEEVMEMRGGQKRKSKRKFYPGYVLVQVEMSDEIWHFIKDIPNVAAFIGGAKPTPISDDEVDGILQREQEGSKKPRPKILFEPGEVVRIIEGPFSEFDGVVEDVNYEKNRLRVLVLIFGRSTPVDLEFNQVQKVS